MISILVTRKGASNDENVETYSRFCVPRSDRSNIHSICGLAFSFGVESVASAFKTTKEGCLAGDEHGENFYP